MNDNDLIIAERYAKSLIEFGEQGEMSYVSIASDLAKIQSILYHSPDLFDALTNPLVQVENKLEIIQAVFEKDIEELMLNFLKVIVEAGRFSLIDYISGYYNQLLDNINGIARILVTSAVELNEAEKIQIFESISKKINKEISIKYKVDESIIAGLIFRMGDDVFDMSLARKLDDLKKTITK